MPLQRFSSGSTPRRAPLALLRFPLTEPLLQQMVPRYSNTIPGSTEQDTLSETFLISQQVVSYQTRDGTCYPRGVYSQELVLS
jgi:hypothetical protein